jgi:hypothetical protein
MTIKPGQIWYQEAEDQLCVVKLRVSGTFWLMEYGNPNTLRGWWPELPGYSYVGKL